MTMTMYIIRHNIKYDDIYISNICISDMPYAYHIS